MDTLERLKSKFLARYPDFVQLSFQATNGSYWKDEREYKDIVIARASEQLGEHFDSDDARGQAMLDCLQQPPANHNAFATTRAFPELQSECSLSSMAHMMKAFGVGGGKDGEFTSAREIIGLYSVYSHGTLAGPKSIGLGS